MKITIGNLELAQFTPRDIRELYLIRNHPSVRRFMTNPGFLSYKAHRDWVQKNLIHQTNLLVFLVRLRGERAIGLTQLQRRGDDTAEIGVMFREANTHLVVPYTSTGATLHLAFGPLRLAWLVSYVVPGHDRAFALNQSFGAWTEESDKPGMIKYRLSREVCLANENYLKVMNRMRDQLTITDADPAGW
jgi:RimJ/RimL family protein N-acetyltransferase